MAADTMQFKEPYNQYIGKWFENTKKPTIKLYIMKAIKVEDIKGPSRRIILSMIRVGDGVYEVKNEWGSEWWLKPSSNISMDSRNAIRTIFK